MHVSWRKHWDFELLGCAHTLSSDIERVADSESGMFPSVRTKSWRRLSGHRYMVGNYPPKSQPFLHRFQASVSAKG